MSPAVIWGILFFVLLGAELLTGTIYLLMVAVGAAVGALAAWVGLDLSWQLGLAGVAATVTTSLLHYKRYKNPKSAIYSENKNALIDIGETLEVTHWTAEKTTRVRYRGAEWDARWIGEGAPVTGQCTIRAIKGSQLQLDAVV